jgi:hypothetical protein
MELQTVSKICSNCKKKFECNAKDIKNCFCQNVILTQDQLQEISNQFSDCLCEDCLLQRSSVR